MTAIERGARVGAIGGISALLFLAGQACWGRLGPSAGERAPAGARRAAAPSRGGAGPEAPSAGEGKVSLPEDLPEMGERLMAIGVGSERRSVLAAFRLEPGRGEAFLEESFRGRGWSAGRAPLPLASPLAGGGDAVFLYTKGRRQCLVHLSPGGERGDPEALVLCDR